MHTCTRPLIYRIVRVISCEYIMVYHIVNAPVQLADQCRDISWSCLKSCIGNKEYWTTALIHRITISPLKPSLYFKPMQTNRNQPRISYISHKTIAYIWNTWLGVWFIKIYVRSCMHACMQTHCIHIHTDTHTHTYRHMHVQCIDLHII